MWPTSFGSIETNKDTIVERGWGTFDYVRIYDPELQDCQTIILEEDISPTA
jgi:hypothetical protein